VWLLNTQNIANNKVVSHELTKEEGESHAGQTNGKKFLFGTSRNVEMSPDDLVNNNAAIIHS
jgi:hypothetical protein